MVNAYGAPGGAVLQLRDPKSRWHYWVSAFFLLQAMAAFGFVDRLVYGEWMDKPGDKITQSLNLLLIASSIALFVHGLRRPIKIGSGAMLALAVVGFLFLSAFWSFDPRETGREALLYLFVVAGAIGIARSLDPDEYFDLLRLTCFFSAVASLLLLAVSPGNALMPDSPDLRGIFSHKNYLGQVMATGVLATLHGMRARPRRLARNLLVLLVFLGVTLASKSATACLIVGCFLSIHAIVTLCRKGGAAALLGLMLVTVLVPTLVIVAFDPDPILALMGKDPSLTGRTELWSYVINDIALKPTLGWGYSAFWSPSNPAAMEITDIEKWYVPQAHNGLLEMLLNIGMAGTGIFVTIFVRNVGFAFRCLRTRRTALAESTLLLYCGLLLLGVSETVLLTALQSSTSVFFISGLMCERTVRTARPRPFRVLSKDETGGTSLGADARVEVAPRQAVTIHRARAIANQKA
jgi:exopolysaccharide production protein ExoQ